MKEQRQALAEAAEAERSLTLVIGRVEDFAAKVHRRLDELDWQGTREIVRAWCAGSRSTAMRSR